MNLPSLPTDNLYKFVALTGLALLITCVVGPWKMSEEAIRTGYEMQMEARILELEAHNILVDTKEVEAEIGALKATLDALKRKREDRQIGSQKTLQSAQELEETLSMISERNRELQEKNRALKIKIEQTKAKASFAAHFESDANRVAHLGTGLAVLGLMTAAVGFWLWYVRVQRYLDAALKREAKQ